VNSNELRLTIPHTTESPVNAHVQKVLIALAAIGYAPVGLVYGTEASIVYTERTGRATAGKLCEDFITKYGSTK
jgi:hypothetical protein